MKDFIYLVQGRSDLVIEYFHLQERDNADAIFLTYDRKINGAVYFPNSTWSEGRNKLLKSAIEKGEYKYYIFCDDDIEIISGSWDEFEKLLLKYKPAIGCPVFPKTKRSKIFFLIYQVFFVNDEQLIAIHHDLVKDNIVVPYQTEFDHLVWTLACSIQERLIQNFYFSDCLQFNKIEVLNKVHNRYDLTERKNSKKYIKEWMTKEFRNNYTSIYNPGKHGVFIKLKVLFYTVGYFIKTTLKPNDYTLNKTRLLEKLNTDSVLLKQYNEKNY